MRRRARLKPGSPERWSTTSSDSVYAGRGNDAKRSFERGVPKRSLGTSVALRNQLADDVAFDVGEAEIAAGVAVGEARVVEAHERQHRRVQFGNVHLRFDGGESEFVGRPVNVTALDAAAGQPHRETIVVVVAAVDLAGVGARLRQFDGGR